MVKHMDKEPLHVLMVQNMSGSGKMATYMDTEPIHVLMVENMSGSSKTMTIAGRTMLYTIG